MSIQMWAITYPGRSTFFLCPHVSGIVDEDHAKRLGAKVLGLRDQFYMDRVSAAQVDLDEGPFDEEDLANMNPPA